MFLFHVLKYARGKELIQKKLFLKEYNKEMVTHTTECLLLLISCFVDSGLHQEKRDVNLIIDLSELTFADFAAFHKEIHDQSPLGRITPPADETLPKYSVHLTQGYTHEFKDFIRQYCYAADILIFKDFIVPFY